MVLTATEGPPVPMPERSPLLDIVQGNFGFHFTIDRGLPGAFQHGLLSRDEERKRGLNTRIRASRSNPDMVYFTTRINNLYFRHNPDTTLEDTLSEVIGIAIDRPDYARAKEGHFGEQDQVEPNRFRALVFLDRKVSEKPFSRGIDHYDAYELGEPLPEKTLLDRAKFLRARSEEAGVDIPIYGVSGDMFWPERMQRNDVIRAIRDTKKDV